MSTSPYYYLILIAILLTTCGYAILLKHVYDLKNADSIPYLTLLPILAGLLIFLFIAFVRKYPIHLMLYLVSVVSIIGILNMKRNATPSKK